MNCGANNCCSLALFDTAGIWRLLPYAKQGWAGDLADRVKGVRSAGPPHYLQMTDAAPSTQQFKWLRIKIQHSHVLQHTSLKLWCLFFFKSYDNCKWGVFAEGNVSAKSTADKNDPAWLVLVNAFVPAQTPNITFHAVSRLETLYTPLWFLNVKSRWLLAHAKC